MAVEVNKTGKGIGKTGVIIHLLLAVAGVAAFLTGDWADDYKKVVHDGFDTHGWIGLGVAAAVLIRLIYGILGPEGARLASWMPFAAERAALVWKGLKEALLLKRPDRMSHRYMAGVVKGFGVILFSWMAGTGSVIYFFMEPGARATGAIKAVMEMQEVGEALIPTYLVLHIGAIVIHALYGRHIWRPMVFAR